MNNLIKLTVKPHIQKEESLFGFLLRCANANGIALCDILNQLKISKYRLHSGDYHKLDMIPESQIDLIKLSSVSNILVEEIKSSTCHNIILKFKGNSKDYNSMFLKKYLRNEFNYCPDCIKEKRIIRLLWKFEPIMICVKHQRVLLNSCHYCNTQIKYNDMIKVGSCPYCLNDLSEEKNNDIGIITSEVMLEQQWYIQAIESLINNYTEVCLNSSELALKILYVLNDFKIEFNRKWVSNHLKEISLIHFLQCARQTTRKNTIHLRTILKILKERDINIGEFLTMGIPLEFTESVLNHDLKINYKIKCNAPWCEYFGLEGKLLATASKNVQHHGKNLKQYYVCPKCGCEYALDFKEGLMERTYFIEAFEILSNTTIHNLTWYEKEKIFGLKRNRILRIFAYFSSRGIVRNEFRYTEKDIDNTMLLNAIAGIQAGLSIHDIQHFNCWHNEEHYLLHRYHSKIIEALVSQRQSFSQKTLFDKDLSKKIESICNQLTLKNQEIKIRTVAKLTGYCTTTIKNKGCTPIIIKYRKQQQIIFRHNVIQRVLESADNYFASHEGEIIRSKELFDTFEVCRNTIRKISLECCEQIDQRRSSWNKQVKQSLLLYNGLN